MTDMTWEMIGWMVLGGFLGVAIGAVVLWVVMFYWFAH